MTPTTLAETILRDVKRYEPDWAKEPFDRSEMVESTVGDWLSRDEVLTALTAALDPALSERAGEVLEGVTPDWEMDATGVYDRVLYAGGIVCVVHSTEADARFIAFCREGVPALLAQIAALRAERETMIDADTVQKMLDDAQPIMAEACRGYEEANADLQARAEAAEAERDRHRRNWERAFNANTALEAQIAALTALLDKTADTLKRVEDDRVQKIDQIAVLTARVEGLTGALEFYADEENYKGLLITDPCGCCSTWYEPKIHIDGEDSGDRARAALSATTEADNE